MTRPLTYPLTLLAAGLLLLPASQAMAAEEKPSEEKPAETAQIVATATGRSGTGAQTITGGDITMSFAIDGKPLSFTRGNGENLINTADPGQGFVLGYGTAESAQKIPLTSLESKDGKLIASAGPNKPRVTFAVTAGLTYIAFRIERIENIPKKVNPVLSFEANFHGVSPEVVPLDYMTEVKGKYASVRSKIMVSWPYLWHRSDRDPLGGFAFFVPLSDEDHNESLLHVWVEENLPHPKISGAWTLERARQWVQEWRDTFPRQDQLTISAKKPGDLDFLIDYAKQLNVNRLYMHTDTWRGEYWPHANETLYVNKEVFPRGEEDLKAFVDKLKANHMDAMLHTVCYGFGETGSKYVGKKPDRRMANWGKGKLEQAISATDKTILFRPDPGVEFPIFKSSANVPDAYNDYWKFADVLIDDELVKCKFTNTDQPVWTLTDCKRGNYATQAADHKAGTESIGLLKAYDQNFYPSSMTDLSEETAREYAEFFNRLGVQHHEYDGAEDHCDVPWGFSKWSMFVYQNTDHPMTSNTSGATPNPWDLVYRFKSGGVSIMDTRVVGSVGCAALFLHQERRLATSPIENLFTLARGAAANVVGFVFHKPEPMFGLTPEAIQGHGLSPLLAEQFATWRELAGKLSPELRKQIAGSYYHDTTPNALDAVHPMATSIFGARKTEDGFELQPFSILVRGKEDVQWKTVQEFGVIMPRQYVLPGTHLRLENTFGRQAPQFIIRVMNGFSDGVVAKTEDSSVAVNKDLDGYMVGAGVNDQPAASAKATGSPSAPSENKTAALPDYQLQPKADEIKPDDQINNLCGHTFTDNGPALEVAYDNSLGEERFQKEGFPFYKKESNSEHARGLGLTVTGDGSGAYLIVQVSGKDYVVPIDFKGRKDIVIPIGEAAWATGRWGLRYSSKRAGYGPVHSVAIGFGRVMAKTYPKVLVENLRLLGETPSTLKDPVIHAGSGTLAITGEVKSDQYLWYQGGDQVGVYDLNWKLVTTLPAVQKDYAVDKGFSEFWIDGQCGNPPPWLDVQFITRGDVIPIKN